MQMNTENKKLTKETKDTFSQASAWKEYSHSHDYFIELLSYDRNHNYPHNNIWEFSYV